jgi:hypothetical protein
LDTIIHLERGAGGIRDIRFSPDNRYVAIAYRNPAMGSGVKVWDLHRNAEQSYFSCPKASPDCLVTGGFLLGPLILWSRDSQTISLGTGARWLAKTGQELGADPIISGQTGRLNNEQRWKQNVDVRTAYGFDQHLQHNRLDA